MNREVRALLSKDELNNLLVAQGARLGAEIAALTARLAELERRFGLNSRIALLPGPGRILVRNLLR